MINYIKSILLLTKVNLTLQGKMSFFGIVWGFFSPLLFILVYSFAFKKIFHVQVENFPLFVTSTLLPWLFFVNSINEASSSFVNNRHILTNLPIDIFKFILSSVLSNYFTFFINQFTLIIIVLALYSNISFLSIFYLLILNTVYFIFVINISIIVSIIKVYFKNINTIIDMFLNALIFVSPVFYGIDMLPEKYSLIAVLNPLFIIFEEFRKVFYYNEFSIFNIKILSFLCINVVFLYILLKILNSLKHKILEII